jgi:hypothetical protein
MTWATLFFALSALLGTMAWGVVLKLLLDDGRE